MSYVNTVSSLEDKASAQVAINLCQDNGFKEVALCLEKPTYGCFIPSEDSPFVSESPFVSDPEKLSLWAKMKKNYRSLDVFKRSWRLNKKQKVKQWDAAVDEQCQRLTEGIPRILRQGVHAWINRIALEYLSYSQRQEVLFGVSRYFLMNIFTKRDWKEDGRLDEKKLAQRLLEDEQLSVLQRYRIACEYCLHVHIPQLWKSLTQEDKQSITAREYPYCSQECRLLVLWSYQMDGYQEKELTMHEDDQWTHAAQNAVYYGNQAALVLCWKSLEECIRQEMVIDMAVQSLQQWQSMDKKSTTFGSYKATLLSNNSPSMQSAKCITKLNLPSYYSKLTRFFLSEMDEEQQLTFFNQVFQSNRSDSVLECFLDWPHQDDFLPTINQLWGIIPKNKYGQCLLTLGSKYSGNNEKENRYYDYRSLLWMLWEETPEEYKQCLFHDKKHNGWHSAVINEGTALLLQLLERSPFQEIDKALFKQIFCYQPQEERRAMIDSKEGQKVCSILMQKEKLSFVNWLLQECLPKEEIPRFKKQFIHSYYGVNLCLNKLKDNCERLVEDLIDWSLELDTEKLLYKNKLVIRCDCLRVCVSLLHEGELAKVEHMINFCALSDQRKEIFKVRFSIHACRSLLSNYACSALFEDCVWEQMDTILAWTVDAEEKIRDLKKNLFSDIGINIHYKLVFIQREWEVVEHFYKWFGLSPEEIKKLKKDTIFTPEVKQDIDKQLCDYTDILVAPLRWCLTDEEMVIDFKKKVEEYFFKHVSIEIEKKAKEQLDYLVGELLYGFRKQEVQDEMRKESIFMKDKGEKRSSIAVEDRSSSQRKQCKSVS